MSLAMRRLKNIGWAALVFFVAILLYPLSLKVATLHSDLTRVERDILQTKREISFLEAEVRTRASPDQLREWNRLLYGYNAPSANQYLEGDRALAELEGPLPDRPAVLVSASHSLGDVALSGSTERPATQLPPSADEEDGDAPAPTPKEQKVQHAKQLAQMERQLISDSTLTDLGRIARREEKR